jgi:hypothetical protein
LQAWYGFRHVIYDLARENPVKIKRVQVRPDRYSAQAHWLAAD